MIVLRHKTRHRDGSQVSNTILNTNIVGGLGLTRFNSIGEYAAFVVAKSLNIQDALIFVATRAKLMAAKCSPGISGMVSCRAPVSEISEILSINASRLTGISIACYNSPEDIVVAGAAKSLEQFIELCKKRGIKQKKLPVPFGFHSPAMDPILEELKDCASSLDFHPPEIKMGSSLRGQILSPHQALQGDYLAKHTRDPVNFSELMKSFSNDLKESDVTVLEVGPSVTSESPYSFLLQLSLLFVLFCICSFSKLICLDLHFHRVNLSEQQQSQCLEGELKEYLTISYQHCEPLKSHG